MLMALPLAGKTPAGEKLLAEGRQLEARKDYDAALERYSKALETDPAELIYMMAVVRTRSHVAQGHLQTGVKLRSEGRLEDALVEFEAARHAGDGTAAAEQEIATTRAMIERHAPAESRGITPVEAMRKERDDRLGRLSSLPVLDPPIHTPVTLTMTNQTSRILFETLGKYTGITVLFDPEYQPLRNANFAADEAPLEQALDNLALVTKSFWKALSRNTIFVTNDNIAKRRDYEEQVTRVFYLSSVNSPQDLLEIINVVRSVTDMPKVFPFSTQYAIVARGEADKLVLAEKVIRDLDKPRSEVVVDILVLEAGKTFSRQIAAAIASTGLNVPVTFTPRASSTTVEPLSKLGHIASSDFSITLPGALLQAALSDADTKILQSPQMRAVDSVKSSLKIGDRQPTATGSFQAGTAATAVNALVNTQFTYIDVGVNVELLSRVHDNGDVTMHLEIEISNVNGTVNLGGIDEPIIGQRKVVQDVRLREGEVNLIAGLTTRQETTTVTGIPGLGAIPILRRLFSGESIDRKKSDLMIAIIPHVVRRPDLTQDNLRGVASGTMNGVKVSYAPVEKQQ
jgi:general secretion pathway protein D